MISLHVYLESAPPTALHKAYARLQANNGLVNNTRVRQEVKDWAQDPSRLSSLLSTWNSTEKTWLRCLYLQGSTGFGPDALAMRLAVGDRYLITPWFDRVGWDFLAGKAISDQTRWYGFHELAPTILELTAPEASKFEGETWDNGQAFLLHEMRLRAWIRLGKLKTTQSGEAHRRHAGMLSQTFAQTHALGELASDRELRLALELQQPNSIGLEKDSSLCALGAETLQELPELADRLLNTWLERQGWSPDFLKLTLQAFDQDICIRDANSWYGGPATNGEQVAWENLAPVLQDMLLLGLLAGTCRNRRFGSLKLGSRARIFLGQESYGEPSAFLTPNFDAHQPLAHVGPATLALELCAQLQKEDQVLLYTLRRENLDAALAQGLDPLFLKEAFGLLRPPAPVDQTLDEWLRLGRGAQAQDAIWIEIEDQDRLRAIEQLPDVDRLCLAIVPNRGLVIDPKHLSALTPLLESFGLRLVQDRPSGPAPTPWAAKGAPRREPIVEFAYQLHEPKEAVEVVMSKDFTFGRHERELDFGQKLRVLEYAILTDQSIEFLDAQGKATGFFHPMRILKQTAPIRLQGFAQGAETETEIDIAEIPSVRIL